MALICHCRAVAERRIVKAVHRGAATLGEIEQECGAGGGCGGCVPAIEQILEVQRRRGAGALPSMLTAHAG